MDRRDFATPKKLYDYAEQTGNVYLWEGMLAFAKRLRVLSPEQYQIVDVRTSRGMRRATVGPAVHVTLSSAANAVSAVPIMRAGHPITSRSKPMRAYGPAETQTALGVAGRRDDLASIVQGPCRVSLGAARLAGEALRLYDPGVTHILHQAGVSPIYRDRFDYIVTELTIELNCNELLPRHAPRSDM